MMQLYLLLQGLSTRRLRGVALPQQEAQRSSSLTSPTVKEVKKEFQKGQQTALGVCRVEGNSVQQYVLFKLI